MKYYATDLGQPILGVDGDPYLVVNTAGTNMESITVKQAFRRALGAVFHDEIPSQADPTKTLPFEKKLLRHGASKKLFNCETTVHLDTDEQAELKMCVNRFFREPEVIGFLHEVIENKTEAAVYPQKSETE